MNGFGETVSEEWPGFGELAQRRRDAEYDSKGRLVRVEETGKPVETRAHGLRIGLERKLVVLLNFSNGR